MNDKGHKKYSVFQLIVYVMVFGSVAWGWIWVYRAYLQHYKELNPVVVWTAPWVNVEYIPSNGLLLWDETVLTSPRAGNVSYPLSAGPVKVAKGAIVAVVGGAAIRAPSQGVFLAALDGMEGKWRYTQLWRSSSQKTSLPKVPKVTWLADGQSVSAGAPIGKIILKPQELRFLGYVDVVGTLERDIERRRLKIRYNDTDTAIYATLRVFDKAGKKAKIFLSLPWLTEEMLMDRGFSLSIEVGKSQGVVVPQQSVTTRGGVRGVFVVEGSTAVFKKVTGKPLEKGRFLVTEGLKMGDAVIVEGKDAREGKVQLW